MNLSDWIVKLPQGELLQAKRVKESIKKALKRIKHNEKDGSREMEIENIFKQEFGKELTE